MAPQDSDPDHLQLDQSAPAWSESGDLVGSGADAEDLEFIEVTGERYALGNLLGEGGMGRVLVAEDKVLRRQVALKGLKVRSEAARQRLAREAWITARLDHPGIVAVHDAGRLPDGTPFYTMRLVRGRSLEDAIAQAGDLPSRLGLVRPLLAACEAVAYAHQAGIVHRDLKPANILLGGFGETQVVDWGLAKALDEAEAQWDFGGDGDAAHTRAGAVVGTPAFMAPEQARGEPADKRSDVFALGATLFVLLTGRPLRGEDSDTALQLARDGHVPALEALEPEAPPELVAIARRALAPDPARRYADAAELAQDLVNWFEGRQVEAHTYTPAQLALRLLQAWRTPIAAALLVLVVIVIAAATTTLRVAEQRDRAVDAEQEARAAERLARDAQTRSDINLARALVQQAQDAVLAAERAKAEVLAAGALLLVDSPEARGALAAFANAQRPRRLERLALPACARATLSLDGRALLCLNEGEAALWALGASQPSWTVQDSFSGGNAGGPGTPVWLSQREGNQGRHFAYDRAGRLLGVTGYTSVPAIHDVFGGRAMGHNAALLGVWSADGQLITDDFGCGRSMATAALDGRLYQLCVDGQLLIGDAPLAPERRLRTPYQGKREPTRAVVLPQLSLMVVATHRGELGAVDLDTGEVRHSVETGLGTIRVLRASPDGQRVAALGVRGGARIWDPTTGNFVAAIPGLALQDVAWESDGVLVALGEDLARWEVPEQATPTHVSLGAGVAGLDIAPDGARFAVSLGDSMLVEVPLDGASPSRIRAGSGEVAKAVAYSLDGRWLSTTTRSVAALTVLDRRTGARVTPADGESGRRQVFVSSGVLVGVSYGTTLDLRRPPDFTGLSVRPQVASPIFDAATTPDGRWAVLLDEASQLILLDGETLALRPLFVASDAVAVDLHPDGQRLATATVDAVRLYDLQGQLLRTLPAPGAGHRDLAFSADGVWVAAGGLDGLTRVWDVESGALLAVLAGHTSRVSALQFAPNAPLLVTGSWDESARVWDLQTLSTPADALAQEITDSWGLSADDMLRR